MPLPGLAKALGGLPDLERGIARLLHRTANPAEFLATLQALAGLRKRLAIQVRHWLTSTVPWVPTAARAAQRRPTALHIVAA